MDHSAAVTHEALMSHDSQEGAAPAPGSEPFGQQGEGAPQPDWAGMFGVLENERNELKDKLLRTLADMENLRRRTEREVADAKAYGVTHFARDMLSVADNIRRALESLPAESRVALEGPILGLVEGIELTERDLHQTLERHGVRKVDPKGEKFDPNLHQAMFEAQNPELPNGSVMEVVQVGYKIGERVLRPALVGVARGGPKASA